MTNIITIQPEQASTSERVADILAVTSAVVSGVMLLLAIVVAF